MSWGIISQGGYLHVNNRPREYIIKKVEKYGFRFNERLSNQWKGFYQGLAIY